MTPSATTPDLHETVYACLVHVARADGAVRVVEHELLERYREALGVAPAFAERVRSTTEQVHFDPRAVATHAERRHLLEMLVRIASADGTVDATERRLLAHAARACGIGKLEFAGMLVAAAHPALAQHRVRRSHVVLLASLVMLALSLGLGYLLLVARTRALERQAALAAAPGPSRPEASAPPPGVPAGVHVAFQHVQRRLDCAVLLLHVRYELRLGTRRVGRQLTGTGFFVSSDGLIVTNKHVVRPWLFRDEDAQLRARGYRVDEPALRIVAWPGGERMRRADGTLDPSTAWSTAAGTLDIVRTAPDRLDASERSIGGRVLRVERHAYDDHDLALLRARTPLPVVCIPLARASSRVAKLDPVMVLGYPGSLSTRDSTRAETAPSLGFVRKLERVIFITASILPGNSGGPLLDSRGEAIGVAFATYGDATAGACIRVETVRTLLGL